MKGKLIVFNGPSSAGKSTLSKGLHEKLGVNNLLLGIDLFMQSMPIGFSQVNKEVNELRDIDYGFCFVYNNEGDPVSIHLTDLGIVFIEGIYKCITSFLDRGFNVLYDDMLFNKELLHIFENIFINYEYTLVKVVASADTRRRRERQRGDRILGTYKIGANFIYDEMYHDISIQNYENKLPKTINKLLTELAI